MCFRLKQRWKRLALLSFGLSILTAYYIINHETIQRFSVKSIFFSKEQAKCIYNVISNKHGDLKLYEYSIFFHETSCKGYLDRRQACSVESAARAHPGWQVNVFFTREIQKKFKIRSRKFFQGLNVELRTISFRQYIKGTPAQTILDDGRLNNSFYKISHTSDILRYTSLYKYGGIYLDLDIIVAKPLDDLGWNWAVKESVTDVASGSLRFSNDKVGRLFANVTMNELSKNFSGEVWGFNGPGVITRVLKNLCATRHVNRMNANTCLGFQVLDKRTVHPIPWQNANQYFEANSTYPETYAYHVWNKLSHTMVIQKNSPYDRLAKKYCPNVYKNGIW